MAEGLLRSTPSTWYYVKGINWIMSFPKLHTSRNANSVSRTRNGWTSAHSLMPNKVNQVKTGFLMLPCGLQPKFHCSVQSKILPDTFKYNRNGTWNNMIWLNEQWLQAGLRKKAVPVETPCQTYRTVRTSLYVLQDKHTIPSNKWLWSYSSVMWIFC